MLFIENIFNKQEKVKMLEEPKQAVNKEKEVNLIDSLRRATVERRKKIKVETLFCEGSGLGIKKKISC
jgi:hypothetical protein